MAEILLLDDVLDAVLLTQKILTRQQHSVHAFTEEEEALAFVCKHRVDLAILDIKLKNFSGIQILEQIKKISPTTKIIMLTGYPTIETAKEALELGAVFYCVKPIDKNNFEEIVATALAR